MRAVARRRRSDDPLDELYAAPLREWVARRKAIAARLRDEDRTEDAKAVARAPKPSATVWAINRVARTAPALVRRLIETFDALKRAQLRAPETMEEAAAKFRDATEAAVHEAISAMREAGLTTSLDTHRRIASSLRGAASSARGALVDGRLTSEIRPAGFDVFAGSTPRGRPTVRAVPPATTESPRGAAAGERARRDDLARRRAAELEAEAGSLEWDATQAAEDVEKARARLRELERKARTAARAAAKTGRLAKRARTASNRRRPRSP